jgi:hypothetical protein
MRSKIFAAALSVLVLGSSLTLVPLNTAEAKAAQCRDAKGKFIKCAAAPAEKPKQCRDAKGKFTKCPK